MNSNWKTYLKIGIVGFIIGCVAGTWLIPFVLQLGVVVLAVIGAFVVYFMFKK